MIGFTGNPFKDRTMANRGTVDGLQEQVSKAGKRYYRLSIDGTQHLAFGKSADTVGSISVGDQVEYSAKPTDSGDASMITFIKKVSGGRAQAPSAPPSPVGTATPKPYQGGGRSGDPTMQMSIFYGYAKDLVAAGLVTTPVTNVDSVADLVSTLADALMRKFKQDTGSAAHAEAPTTAPAAQGAENPR